MKGVIRMILPPYALQAARVIAWAMTTPDPDAAAQVRRLRSARLEDLGAVWAEVLSDLSRRSEEAGGPGVTQSDLRALIQWFASARFESLAAQGAAKQAILAEARRLAGQTPGKTAEDGGRWVRPETFPEFRAVAVAISDLPDPAPEGWPAPLRRFPLGDLLEHAIARGGVAFKALNNRGELEIYFLTDSPERIRDVKWDFACGPQQEEGVFEVDLAVHVRPGHPRFYTHFFDMATARGRYEAAAFCEQRELRVFAIAAEAGGATVALCRRIHHPEGARRTFRNHCRRALGLPMEAPPPGEVPVDEVFCGGTAYRFEPGALLADGGVRPEVVVALERLARDRSKLIRQGPFTLWLAPGAVTGGCAERASLILTPTFRERTGGRTQRDPLLACFRELGGFIGSGEAFPVCEGAVPLYRYVDGRVYPVEQTDELLGDLRDAWEVLYQDGTRPNPYGAGPRRSGSSP